MVRYRMRSPSEGPHQGPGEDHEREEQGQGQGLSPERVEDYGRTHRGHHHHRHRHCSRKRLHRIHKRRRSCRRRRRHSCRHRRRHRRGEHPTASPPRPEHPYPNPAAFGQPSKPELFFPQAAEDLEGGGDAGAGNAGGTITKPPQACPFCLEPRKSPAQGIVTCPKRHVRPHHHSMLSEP